MICKFHYYFHIIVYTIFNQMERAMYPTRNYFINNNAYSTNNNYQHQPQTGPPNANSTGFFPRPVPHQQNQNAQQQPLSLSYIYPANSFQFRPQPPHVLNSQPPSAFSLPTLPPPPSFNQLPLQGFFAAPPFPTINRQQPPQQLTTSNFAGRNVIFSSSTVQSSQNHLVNPPPTKVTVSSIPNALQQQSILPSPPILPSTIPSPTETVPISDELHINASNLSEAISEDHNNPFGKRTVINEQALANLAKKNQQNDRTKEAVENPTQNVNGGDQQPNLAATTTESSPESVKIGDEQEEEDEEMENPEMPKNWRMMMLFNGRIRDSDLPPNCERPQNAEGIEFPYPESLSKWKFVGLRQPPEDMDLDDEDSDEAGELSPMEGTSQQISGRRNKQSSRAKSLPPPPVPPPPPILNQNERGYVLPNGRTWVRHPPQPQPPVEIAQQEKVKSPTTHSAIPPHPTHSPRNRIQKRFANNTLLIMKNGKRLQSGTKECYQFAETGTCQNGIFCTFEHNGSVEHTTKRVCNRLLRGLCPAETGDADNCPGGPHSPLLPHQMPICDFYQRLCCRKGKEKCPFLHVRHTPGTQPCAEFNRGNCQRGIMCDAPHRYYYDQIKQKSSDPKQPQIRSKTTTKQAQNRQNHQQQNNNIRLHLNTENEAANTTNEEEQLRPPSPPLKWIDE